jgi:hypothetical protein
MSSLADLSHAASTGNVEMLNRTLPLVPDIDGGRPETALSNAAEAGHVLAVKKLLYEGADPNVCSVAEGRTVRPRRGGGRRGGEGGGEGVTQGRGSEGGRGGGGVVRGA